MRDESMIKEKERNTAGCDFEKQTREAEKVIERGKDWDLEVIQFISTI